MSRKCLHCTVTSLLATFLLALSAQQTVAQQQGAKKKPPANPAFAKVEDDAKLPRVLLIGDSISIGYTPTVRKALTGKANVHRIPTNGGPTTRGVESIDAWLGDGEWDVIHFNWGLHDLKFIGDERQVSPEDYEKNLRALTERMKKTGATLIWCSTTPFPEKVNPKRIPADTDKYNAAAARVMKDLEVETNDLHGFALERLEKIQRPNNVHFTPAGSQVLGEEVARQILARIPAQLPKE